MGVAFLYLFYLVGNYLNCFLLLLNLIAFGVFDFQNEMKAKSSITGTAEEMTSMVAQVGVGCGSSSSSSGASNDSSHHYGVCAICLDKIMLQETALVKGCEHAYWFVFALSCPYL